MLEMKDVASKRPPGAAGAEGAEVEGLAALAWSLSTPMRWPMAYYRICVWLVHRDWRDGAGLRRPSSCAGSRPILRVRGAGLAASGASEHCVLSMLPCLCCVVLCAGYQVTTCDIHEDQGSARCLEYQQGYVACSGSRAGDTRSRRRAQPAHDCVRRISCFSKRLLDR
ncbi:hypothetical protein IW261DRAFT_1062018 [Armillaria novae-zelandiae]|uniref:Uncharacterized protein n=1 Tax=Armillaria novae-zelandiae TaxID=153914 RepID=A0AA39NKS0_9AGAR|nr:hypothetical protein IW261DRAFT_1062018 [Armillaria novae-zelandiae]